MRQSNDRRRAVTPNYNAIIEETSQPIDIGSSDLCRSADGVTTVTAESMVKVRHWDSATSIHPNRRNLRLEEHAVRGTRNKSSMRSPRAPHTTRAARARARAPHVAHDGRTPILFRARAVRATVTLTTFLRTSTPLVVAPPRTPPRPVPSPTAPLLPTPPRRRRE